MRADPPTCLPACLPACIPGDEPTTDPMDVLNRTCPQLHADPRPQLQPDWCLRLAPHCRAPHVAHWHVRRCDMHGTSLRLKVSSSTSTAPPTTGSCPCTPRRACPAPHYLPYDPFDCSQLNWTQQPICQIGVFNRAGTTRHISSGNDMNVECTGCGARMIAPPYVRPSRRSIKQNQKRAAGVWGLIYYGSI